MVDWKQVLISIVIGAIVAFITQFLEGALEALNGLENNVAGGFAATVRYALAHK